MIGHGYSISYVQYSNAFEEMTQYIIINNNSLRHYMYAATGS
jgi:hypothetical protein